ncbi:SAF domain-containing protein [Streptomyces sp. MW-W600-10]|uniref:SAF domain-containing protein n=1 Tax=Streptomyces sp. MW-W600-10 TaxID=2829819 RepID=UPI001C483ADC|nr:SAF domain-containing protein [Streptomyces sp. MW-W600-10]MBV7249288.1 SAF domain-containing protein [Streptomyces sp. MW-W600-10]
MDTTTPISPPIGAPRQPDLGISDGARKSAKPRRKWVQAVAFILLAVVGALVAISAVNRAGDRVSVLALARDVQAGQQIAAADLVIASVADDPALAPVPAGDRTSMVGQRAAVDLRQGSLLTRSQLQAGGGLGDDQQVVGVEVKKGYAPRDELRPGDLVLAVVLPAQGEASETNGAKPGASPEGIEATVKSVGRTDASGSVVVNLVVEPTDGPLLATKAAAKQIALVRQPRESER